MTDRSRTVALVSSAFLLPPLGVFLADRALGAAPRIHEVGHLACELVGSCIALAVAGLLTMRTRLDPKAGHLAWVTASLVAMGTTDAIHALLPFGIAWSWLRHLATLEGGGLFALVWVRGPSGGLRRTGGLPWLVGLAALVTGLLLWIAEPWLPPPWTPTGYTGGAQLVNALGGMGFFAGGVWFARRYLTVGPEDNIALAIHAALFASAGLVFGLTTVWTPGWWWIHGCRLLAYLVVLVAAWRMAGRSFSALAESARELDARVAERTRALVESEARIQAITWNAPVGIAYVDTDLVVRFANPAIEAWCGLPPERMAGMRLREVVGPEAFANRQPLVDEALGGRRVRFEGEPPVASPGPRHSDSTYIPDIGEDGRVRGVYMFVVDVTDLKQAQIARDAAQAELREHADGLERLVAERTATLREAVQELEAFSYSIAHDMRAPLRAMQGYAVLLGEHGVLDERGREFLGRIRASAERMDQLIRDVLDYSLVVRRELPVTTVETGTLLSGIVASYPQLHAPGVTVELVGPFPRVRANPGALTQVFSNLLGNAVKFVAPGVPPRVVVRSEPRTCGTARWIRFWVEDNGIGMEVEDTTRIFGMFQRLRSAGAYAGTGMGLAIVQKAIHRMGGRVGVESRLGQGSRFWFELPEPP